MPITFADNRATVTYDSGVDPQGGASGDPWTLSHILTESDAGTWGMENNENHFYIPFSIYVEDGAYFRILNEVVTSDAITDTLGINVLSSAGGIQITDSLVHNTPPMSNGKSFTIHQGGIIERSVLSGFWRPTINGTYGSTLVIKDTEFHDFNFINGNSYLTLEDIIFTKGTFGVFVPKSATGVSMSGLSFVDCHGTVYMQDVPSEFTVRNVEAKNTTYSIVYWPYRTYVADWIDCQVDPADILVYNIGTNTTGVTQFKSTFEWLLGDGVNVKVYDNGNLVLDKDVNNGDTDEIMYAKRTIIRGASGLISNELEVYEPFDLVVTKAGYQDLDIPEVSVEPGQVTTIRSSLILEPLQITAIAITDTTHVGETNGQIEITAEGGDLTYEYSIDNVNWQVSNTFTGLAAGTYTVYVRDGQTVPFTDSFTVEVQEPTLQPVPDDFDFELIDRDTISLELVDRDIIELELKDC